MRRGRLFRRLAVASAIAVLVPVVAGWWWMSSGETVVELHKVADSSFDWRPGQPVFVLVIGSDERAGLSGRRGDALHVIGINPKAKRGTILNFPRDSWVDVPGHGAGRINEGYYYGGAQLQAETIRRLTGIPISVAAVTTFEGLASMVDAMGGIDVHVPIPMSDPASGAFFSAGWVHMSGGQALAFARNRHIHDGDFTRSFHQAHLLLSALQTMQARGTGRADTVRYLSVLLRHTDLNGLRPTDAYRLARLALSFDVSQIRNVTMPGRVGMVGAQSVVFVDGSAAGLFADFRDDAVLQSH